MRKVQKHNNSLRVWMEVLYLHKQNYTLGVLYFRTFLNNKNRYKSEQKIYF